MMSMRSKDESAALIPPDLIMYIKPLHVDALGDACVFALRDWQPRSDEL